MTLGQHFSNYVTHKSPNSEISQWYSVAFFIWKIIFVETCYKTNNQELLAIVEAFKTWHHDLEDWKYEVFIRTNYNNLRQFMDTKSLNFRQVCLAQKLCWYLFLIDYHQEKANVTAEALSRLPQRSQAEEKTFRDENSQILHCLQSLLTRANIVSLSFFGLVLAINLFLLHQVLIYRTYILP